MRSDNTTLNNNNNNDDTRVGCYDGFIISEGYQYQCYSVATDGGERIEEDNIIAPSNIIAAPPKPSSSESDYLLERYNNIYKKPPRASSDDGERASSFLDRMSDLIFSSVLGFQSNPFSTIMEKKRESTARKNATGADLRLSILSNLSTSYNILSISLALHLMRNNNNNNSLYPQQKLTPKDSSLCSSALLVGMIVGQLAGGMLGDVLGRHRAMAAVMCLQVVAAFASAFSNPVQLLLGDDRHYYFSIFQVLSLWRFILGLGCGGVYPLSATLTAESSQSSVEDRAKAVALAFSFQGIGYLLVPVVSLIIIGVLGEDSDVSWRLILATGCIPGILLTILRMSSAQRFRQRRSLAAVSSGDLAENQSKSYRVVPDSIMDALLMEKDLVRKFLGTGGCWLLFDILFYGNTLFQPVVLSNAFGQAETVAKTARDTIIIALLALPGYYASVYAVGRQSPRTIQCLGFFCMGILYVCIGTFFVSLSRNRGALLAAYGGTFFFSNYGPNATTFMLPSITYSRACRSTLNGVCAASGKTGALIGALVFVQATHQYGERILFIACGILAFVGCAITLVCVSPTAGEDDLLDSITLNSLDSKQHDEVVQRMSRASMRVVFSEPSLVDYHTEN